MAALAEDAPLGRVRHLRDKVVAHHLPDQVREATFYNDVEDAIDVALAAVFALGAGVGITTVSFDAVTEVWADRSMKYWANLLARGGNGTHRPTRKPRR